MALINYNPNNAFPDLDGTGGQGPLQIPQDADPYTYEVHYVGSGGTANKHGLFGKILDGLFFIKVALYGSGAPPTSSSTFTRTMPPTPSGNWNGNGTALSCSSASASSMPWYLNIPNGATLVSIVVNGVQGAAADVALPATMPQLLVYKIATNGTQTQIGSTVTDTSANLAAYQAPHTITFTAPGGTVVDNTAQYVAFLNSEGGANAHSGMTVSPALSVTWQGTQVGR